MRVVEARLATRLGCIDDRVRRQVWAGNGAGPATGLGWQQDSASNRAVLAMGLHVVRGGDSGLAVEGRVSDANTTHALTQRQEKMDVIRQERVEVITLQGP